MNRQARPGALNGAVNADYLNRCVQTLESAFRQMQKEPDNISYEIYRAACVKEFEIILEQCGKLLKKKLRAWFPSNKAVDKLTFKDIFRNAAKHSLINVQQSRRWIQYRDSRNNTAHDCGENFAEEILKLLPSFIDDAKSVVILLQKGE